MWFLYNNSLVIKVNDLSLNEILLSIWIVKFNDLGHLVYIYNSQIEINAQIFGKKNQKFLELF